MKKIFGLLIVSLLFVGCDDGDLVVESISLDGIVPVKCTINNILYKIKDNQSLALEIADIATAFKNKKETKAIITIDNSTNKLIFRTYNGEVKASNICATTFDAFPSVAEEWIAQYGTIEINTTVVNTAPATSTNATRISKYNHSIILKNVGWLKPDGSIQLETIDRPFGVYQTDPSLLPFGFAADAPVLKSTCLNDNTIVALSGSEAMRLKLDPTAYTLLFTTVSTLPNAPKTQVVNATNKLTYNFFESAIALADFCALFPATPASSEEEWTAKASTSATNGIIEVETTSETSASVRHTIYVRGITFDNGNVTFYYGDRILFGYFIAAI
jgi:hypothetical protein